MSTYINKIFTIPCDLKTAIRLMSDASSLERLMEFSYALNPEHHVLEYSDGSLEINIHREFEGTWPSFVEPFIGPTLKIDEKRIWQAAEGNKRLGKTVISASGLPVDVKADMTIAEKDNSCTVSIVGKIKVNVIVIGGKIERLIQEQIYDAIDVERDFYLEELKK
ncbi:MAG: hypothetical protein RLZZ330_110 [Actinomycetota bacterium]